MTQKISHLLTLVLFLLSCPLSLFALYLPERYDFAAINSDGVTLYYEILSSTTCELSYGPISYPSHINIPSTVTNNEKTYSVTQVNFFKLAESDVSSINIPSSVTSICWGTMYFDNIAFVTVDSDNPNYSSLDGVIFDKDQSTLIYFPSSKEEEYAIPNSVTAIGDKAFTHSSLSSITIPNSVTSIGADAFCRSDLTSIILPSGLTSIESRVFLSCRGLTSITLPSSLTSIGESAFWNCSSLTSITALATTPPSIADGTFSDISSATLYVPASSLEAYKKADNWKDFGTIKGIVASGNCGAQGDNLTWTLTDDGVLTISGSGEMEDSFDYPIWSNYDVKSVVIADGVTSIGDCAFWGCRGVTLVEIPSSVTNIGAQAFRECCSLSSIEIPSSVTNIGTGAFMECGVTSIEIPSSVINIGEDAFYACSLQTIKMPSSLMSIGSCAFESVSLSSITITTVDDSENILSAVKYPEVFSDDTYSSCILYVPSGTKSAFQNANGWKNFANIKEMIASGNCGAQDDNLTWTLTDDGVLTISGSGAMKNYDSHYNDLTYNPHTNYAPWDYMNFEFWDNLGIWVDVKSIILPNGITRIGDCAFSGCSLTTVEIPSSVMSIGDWAFEGCGLTSINIPSSVERIGNGAFDCHGLTSVEIPSSVTSIGYRAFPTSMTSIVVDANNPVYDSRNNCNGIIETATNELIIACESTIIPSTVTSIGEKAFFGCSMTSIELPSSVKNIGFRAFEGCSSLTSIDIPSSMTNIGSRAFAYSSLTSIKIPASVTIIEERTFMGCTQLTSIELSSTVTNIEYGAFEICENLGSITITSVDNSESILSAIEESGHEFSDEIYSSCILYVPVGTKSAFQNANGWKNFAYIEEYEEPATDISTLDYAIYAPDTEVVGKKQFQLPIYLKNDNLITSWQADLVLPEGFSIATDSYGDPMVSISGSRTTTSRHSVATNTLASGDIRIFYRSSTNIEISGNDGEIATITINMADDIEEGDYAITFKNILMVEKNKTGHDLARTVSKVNVKHFLLGDPNNDGKINALDLVILVNYIFEIETAGNIREAADMDGNGIINAIDYVMMVDLIMNQPESNAAPTRDAEDLAGSLYMAPFAMTAGEMGTTTLYLDGTTADYTCLQFDLALPVGISITNAESLSARHTLSYQAMADGSICFLLSSSANKPILTDDGIIRLTLQADDTMADGTYCLSIDNTLLVTDNADAFSPEDMTCPFTVCDPAGISSISLDESAVKAYNLSGQQVQFDARQMSAGIYVIDGKKVIVE